MILFSLPFSPTPRDNEPGCLSSATHNFLCFIETAKPSRSARAFGCTSAPKQRTTELFSSVSEQAFSDPVPVFLPDARTHCDRSGVILIHFIISCLCGHTSYTDSRRLHFVICAREVTSPSSDTLPSLSPCWPRPTLRLPASLPASRIFPSRSR